MSSSNLDKTGVDNSGMHSLQYAAFVLSAFVIYFGLAFFYDYSFHNFVIKHLSFVIAMDITL